MFRIIQSIPSPKVESIKQWLAKTGSERIKEEANPQLAINRVYESMVKKNGKEWAKRRIQGMIARSALTDYWEENGIEERVQYAQLTDTINTSWSGMTSKGYKEFKGLSPNASLRDNMTATELALAGLAETLTLEEAKNAHAYGFDENHAACERGGNAAYNARLAIEKSLNRSVLQGKSIKQ